MAFREAFDLARGRLPCRFSHGMRYASHATEAESPTRPFNVVANMFHGLIIGGLQRIQD